MSKKIMNPPRWRLLAIITAMYVATYALWAVLYVKAPDAKRAGMLFVIIFTSCLGFLGIGTIIALFFRFPAQTDEDQD
jgi:hypothetical protein